MALARGRARARPAHVTRAPRLHLVEHVSAAVVARVASVVTPVAVTVPVAIPTFATPGFFLLSLRIAKFAIDDFEIFQISQVILGFLLRLRDAR